MTDRRLTAVRAGSSGPTVRGASDISATATPLVPMNSVVVPARDGLELSIR